MFDMYVFGGDNMALTSQVQLSCQCFEQAMKLKYDGTNLSVLRGLICFISQNFMETVVLVLLKCSCLVLTCTQLPVY